MAIFRVTSVSIGDGKYEMKEETRDFYSKHEQERVDSNSLIKEFFFYISEFSLRN